MEYLDLEESKEDLIKRSDEEWEKNLGQKFFT